MLDREDATNLSQYLTGSKKLVELLEELADEAKKNTNSSKYLALKKEFETLYEETDKVELQLVNKPDVKTFINDFELREDLRQDLEPDRQQLTSVRGVYKLLNDVQEIVDSAPIDIADKVALEKQIADEFSKVTDFTDKDQLTAFRIKVDKILKPFMSKIDDKQNLLKTRIADLNNIERIKAISMGEATDEMGGPKLSLGYGQRFQGVLGEIKESLQLLRNSVDSNNNKNKYFAKFTDIFASNILGFINNQNKSQNKIDQSPTPKPFSNSRAD